MTSYPSTFDVIIIGGGLAGLSSAIHLSKEGYQVLVIEKNEYPKHKVCGEYISNEVLPYLDYLEIDVFKLGAKKINKFALSTPKGKLIKANLPLGGFGISRYVLDYELAKKAKACNAEIIKASAEKISFYDDLFSVTTKSNQKFISKIVIGAYGKRSALDISLDRNFIKNKSPFLAVKTHVKGNFPQDVVALHNFKGGYCGVSMVEGNTINLCYIADFKSFKTYKNIDDFQEKVLFKNKYLKTVFENSEIVFDAPLTISQVSFSSKTPVEDHVIMCGDTAGMIHPLCGNGMSMAIRSAQMASHVIINYLQGKIDSRKLLEQRYTKIWNAEFKNRLKIGHVAANLFNRNGLAEVLIIGLKWFPSLLPKIIKRTHGKVMKI